MSFDSAESDSSSFVASSSVSSYTRAQSKLAVFLGGIVRAGLVLALLFTFPIWGSLLYALGAPVVGAAFPPAEVTVERLIEQARGEKFYWNQAGEKWWATQESLCSRYPKRRARSAAIKKLSEYQPLPEKARVALVSMLLAGESDYDSGDGVYEFRSSICCTLGLAARNFEAYNAIIDMFRMRATSPEMDDKNHIKWFDKSWGHYGDWHTGPGPMVRALKYTPRDHHEAIKEKLELLRSDLESSPQHSQWAMRELKMALEFFDSNDRNRFQDIAWEAERASEINW